MVIMFFFFGYRIVRHDGAESKSGGADPMAFTNEALRQSSAAGAIRTILKSTRAVLAAQRAGSDVREALQLRALQFLFLFANRLWTRFLSQALP
jgi:hypothetical protein